jgi:hypothetical protein
VGSNPTLSASSYLAPHALPAADQAALSQFSFCVTVNVCPAMDTVPVLAAP